MKPNYLGNAADVVKQAMLTWLSSFGPWSVHPMFTEQPTEAAVSEYSKFLGARVITTAVLTRETDRASYFECLSSDGNVLLDPDIGLWTGKYTVPDPPRYVLLREFREIVWKRPKALTLVFDQSIRRYDAEDHQLQKLELLRKEDIFGFAYVSSVCILVASREETVLRQAYGQILLNSRLPKSRLAASPGLLSPSAAEDRMIRPGF